MGLKVLLLVLFLSAAVLADDSKTYSMEFAWSGATPTCKNCGNGGEYACSAGGIGNWDNGTKRFHDPSSYPFTTLANVTVTLWGDYSCSSTKFGSTIKVFLSGQLIGEKAVTSNNACACGTCDGPIVFDNTIHVGWSNYQQQSQNSLQVVVGDDDPICLHKAQLNLTFVSNPAIAAKTIRIPFSGGAQNCSQCSGAGEYSCNSDNNWTGIATFTDPVPSDSIVTAVKMYLYGSYYFSSTNYITANLQGIKVNQVTITSTSRPPSLLCGYCSSRLEFDSVQSYQLGWPHYVYGGQNQVQFTLSYSYVACFSEVEIALLYVPRHTLSADLQ